MNFDFGGIGSRDLEFIEHLDEVCAQNGLDITRHEVLELANSDDDEIDPNVFIYCALEKLAKGFIEDNMDEISEILGKDSDYILDHMTDGDWIFSIYTNYIDSRLGFENMNVQNLYEESSYNYQWN